MLVPRVPTKGAHHDDDGHTQASVWWADRLPLPPPSPFPLCPPFAPPLFPAILRTCVGVNGCSRGCSDPVPFCRCLFLILLSFPHENLRPFLDPSEPSAGFVRCLAPPFELDAKLLEVLLKVPHPVPLLSSGVALTPDHLPKYHPLRQTRLSHACHKARKQ